MYKETWSLRWFSRVKIEMFCEKCINLGGDEGDDGEVKEAKIN
jgi:hypothetical protein